MSRRAVPRWGTALLLTGLPLLVACGGIEISDTVKETAVNVVTLQRGTISELKSLRGHGPFRSYDLAPAEMLKVVASAARRARGLGDQPVRAIFVSEIRGEVVAKERSAEDAHDEGYAKPFRSAMVATVHAVPGVPARSNVEIHAMQRGPFHGGTVAWERDMPAWIDAALAERAMPPPRIRPIR